jgi:hypothetical protein
MGFDFKQFTSILTLVAPVVLLAVPGGAALAPLAGVIIKGIQDAQQQPGKTGPEKKAFVLTLVQDAASGTNLVKPGTIDQPLVVEAAGHAIDAVIGTVNAIQTAHAALPTVPALALPPAA